MCPPCRCAASPLRGGVGLWLLPHPAALPQLLGWCFAAASSLQIEGAVFGSEPRQGRGRRPGGSSVGGWLRSRAAACGRYRRGGAGAAVCFLQAGAAPRRKNRAPQPGWVQMFPRQSGKVFGSQSAVRVKGNTEVCPDVRSHAPAHSWRFSTIGAAVKDR